MRFRKPRAAALQARRLLGNIVRANVLGRHNVLPHFAVYYVTHHCNAHCEWCSRGEEVFASAKVRPNDLDRTRQLLTDLRKIVPTLYITGGEPLVLRDVEKRLETAQELGFFPIALNTNAILLDRRWAVLDLVDTLVVSLHSVDPKQLASTYQVPLLMAERALANIVRAAQEAAVRNVRIVANCVLTEESLGGAHEVLDFCLMHGIAMTVVPVIINQMPVMESSGDDVRRAYERFMDRVIEQKARRPSSIQGSYGFLRKIRNFGRFKCRPSAFVVVTPDGKILDSCDMRWHAIGDMAESRSVITILREGLGHTKPFQPCPKNCLKACYVETATALESPLHAARQHFVPWL